MTKFAILCFLYGISSRQTPVLAQIALIDMFGIESLKVSFSVMMFFSGMTTLVGPPLLGWLKVIWGSYDFAFIITSGFWFMGGILAFIVLWMHKRNSSSEDTVSAQEKK